MKKLYKIEWENGLTAYIRSKAKLQDVKINLNQEGLRSICEVVNP